MTRKESGRIQADNSNSIPLPAEGFCGIRALAQPLGCTPFARSTIWLRVKQGKFPAPERFGARCSRWRVESVRAYLADPMGWEMANSPKA